MGDGGDTRGGRAGMVAIAMVVIAILVRAAHCDRETAVPAVAVFSPQAEGRV